MTGGSPYREGEPLRDVIPPDRRRQKALLLIAFGILAGLGIAEGLRAFREPEESIAVGAISVTPPTTTTTMTAAEDGERPRERTQDELTRTIAAYRPKVLAECWRRDVDPKLARAKVTATVTIGETGNVVSVTSVSDAPVVATCVEGQIRAWHFQATGARQTVAVPFAFARD